ncbi:MAG: protoporphyrinogen oxidase [Conexivisphaerales archaeon]
MDHDYTSIITGKHVRSVSINPYDKRFEVLLEDGSTLRGRSVVFATPAYITADILSLPELSMLKSIRYASVVVVTLAFRHEIKSVFAGTGFLIPSESELRISACTITSNKWSGFSPPGYTLLRCYLDTNREASILDYSDKQLAEIVLKDLRAILSIAEEPLFIKVNRWKNAFPCYSIGHREKIRALEEAISLYPGLHIAGASYHGISISDCIQQAESTAYKVLNFLNNK